jgi:hypothetical protein
MLSLMSKVDMTVTIMDFIYVTGRRRLNVVNDRGRLLEIVLSLMPKETDCWKKWFIVLVLFYELLHIYHV